MSLKRRQFTPEFEQQVLREIEAGKSIAQAVREYQSRLPGSQPAGRSS